MDIDDDVDMHKLPYADFAAFAFGNLPAFELGDAKTGETRSGAMRSFMLVVR